MPKATRSSQKQRTYRATPLVSQNLTSQQERYRLRQLQAQNIAQQQVQQQQARAAQQQIQQQQQQLVFPSLDDMNQYTHINGNGQLAYGSSMTPMPSALYAQQSMPHQQPRHPMLPQPSMNSAPSLPTHVSTRPSSGAWSPQDDTQLMTARAAGQNWSQIQSAYFPTKTANACRKRHERLADRKNNDEWDALKLEALGTEYMAMRKEIWAPLADKVGEKWTVVEAKVFSQGFKGMQAAARQAQRRMRHSAGGSAYSSHDGQMEAHASSSYTDDSALGEDVDEYGSPNTDYDHYDSQTGEYMSQQHSRKASQQMYQPSQSQMMPGMNSQYMDDNRYAAGGMGMPPMMRHGTHSHTDSLGSNMSNGGRDMGIQNLINRGV